MRKIKEVLRLKFESQLGQRQIAASCSIGQATVAEYLKRAEAAAVSWPLPADWTESRLEQALFGRPRQSPEPTRRLPDFAAHHEQLQRHRHLTLQLLWEEYRQNNPDGYQYSYFCEAYQKWRRKQDLVLRQEHKAGDKLFVDWAGDTLPLFDRQIGQKRPAYLFVAVMGASSYTYAEASWDQQSEAWVGAHIRALEFFGGVPNLVVPDNAKTAVSKPCRYEPDINPAYQDLATHYGFAVLPARPYKPRDKAKVEAGVLVAERWIIAAMRHQQGLDLVEANGQIGDLLRRINNKPFRKREGTRAGLFAALDQAALRPLPETRFEMSQWSKAKVNIDYHIAFANDYYSVPYQLTQEQVDVRATATTVEIFRRGERVTSHQRGPGRGVAITLQEHRPRSHQAHLEWPPSRMVEWAGKIGPHTAQLFEKLLANQPHPEMGYRSCLGLIRMADEYTPQRMEAAAQRALAGGAARYRSVKSILEKSLDRQPLPDEAAGSGTPAEHDNIRGAEYFQREEE